MHVSPESSVKHQGSRGQVVYVGFPEGTAKVRTGVQVVSLGEVPRVQG